MPYTTCPYCNKRSYSAADLKVWTCPYCGRKVVEKEKEEQEKSTKEQGE
ncbi:hypothetical protein [Thermoanaerobacterium sp. DL9XJH110]